MKLKTTLLGKTYQFKSVKDVLAKANEEKTGDQLAGLGGGKGCPFGNDPAGSAGESGGSL